MERATSEGMRSEKNKKSERRERSERESVCACVGVTRRMRRAGGVRGWSARSSFRVREMSEKSDCVKT